MGGHLSQGWEMPRSEDYFARLFTERSNSKTWLGHFVVLLRNTLLSPGLLSTQEYISVVENSQGSFNP